MTRLCIARPGVEERLLASALRAEFVPVPQLSAGPGWAWSWTDELAETLRRVRSLALPDQIVVCTWGPDRPGCELADLDPAEWMGLVELELSVWSTIIAAVCDNAADRSSVAVVAERPAALDSAGYGPQVTVAEGLLAVVRSLAMQHGPRNIRVNAVFTQIRTTPGVLAGTSPTLAGFPGDVEDHLAGTVEAVLDPGCGAITASAVRADFGRAWT